MNAQQRKFLIDKLKDNIKKQIEALNRQKTTFPPASNYIFKAILNNELELQSHEVILAALKRKALETKEGGNWLSEQNMGWDKERTVRLDLKDLIVLPKDFYDKMEEAQKHNRAIDEKCASLTMQSDTLEMRIQLSSDKTLQKMINEVDDMGDISLIDTKIKLLNA